MSDEALSEASEKLQGYVTLAITVAARIMEVQATRRQQQLKMAQRQSEQAAQAVREQQRAEAAAVKHQLRDVGRKDWWDRATPEEIGAAYATARAYGQIDPELAGTAQYMAQEIERRYGVHADQLVGETAGTDAWMSAVGTDVGMAASEATRDRMEDARRQAAAETGEALTLVAEANAVDARVHADGVVTPREEAVEHPRVAAGWDEAARREGLADRLEGAEIPADAVQARMAADHIEGRPAAVTPGAHGHGKPPRARTAPAKGQQRVRGR